MNSFTNEDIQLAVKKGAYWLDHNYPNWASEIDLEILEMIHCENCIIGQAVGDYFQTVASGGSDTQSAGEWAEEHGFDAPFIQNENSWDMITEEDRYYGELETVWSEEVRKRLG